MDWYAASGSCCAARKHDVHQLKRQFFIHLYSHARCAMMLLLTNAYYQSIHSSPQAGPIAAEPQQAHSQQSPIKLPRPGFSSSLCSLVFFTMALRKDDECSVADTVRSYLNRKV